MVIIKSWYLEDGVEGFPGFLFARSNSRRDIIVDRGPYDLYSFAMHLAFHFLDLLLLNTDLDPPVVHLGY